MLKYIRLFCLLLFACHFFTLNASTLGGLRFKGGEVAINKRTCYDVFTEKEIEFSDYYDICFDLSLLPETKFGYLFRIKNRDSKIIYNLFYDGQGNDIVFRLNEEGKNSLIVAHLNTDELLKKHWFNFNISFDLENDSISLQINDHVFSKTGLDLPDTYAPIILFGKSDYIIDVPSFAIKNLSVGSDIKYLFPLNEKEGNIVHSEDSKGLGNVINPVWLINDAYHWKSKTSFKSKSVAGSNYYSNKKEILYFNRDTLIKYNVRSEEVETIIFDEQCPSDLILGTNYIDTKNNKLYSYESYYVYSYNGPTVSSLDLDRKLWSAESKMQLPSQLHHHTSFFNPANQQITIFGGFGRMHYSNAFFSYDTENNVWDTIEDFQGDFLSPRYFSSLGYLENNNSLYIFGGMGNESGEQLVGRKYYYDLYKIDLNSRMITKLWEIPWNNDNVVPVRGMVILNDSSFYTLCYPEHFTDSFLKLYQFSIKDGSYKILGDSIPIFSDRITTNANLYHDKELNNLYAVIQEFDDDISSELTIYSLAFPPITAKELASYSKTKNSIVYAILLIVFIMLLTILVLQIRKQRTKKSVSIYTDGHTTIGGIKPVQITVPNAIYLFGEFMVRDTKDRDISYMFSTKLRQAFCLILQHSFAEGISSQSLSSELWPDKPSAKVKNSRGVTINHLRKVLNELEGIQLIFEKGHFKLVFEEGLYCDYIRCMNILQKNEKNALHEELIRILSRGKFLKLDEDPIFDSIKESLERKLTPVLLSEMEKTYSDEAYKMTINFADAIFNIDPLNENAFELQIKAMQKLRLSKEAKIKYQSFIFEYKKSMGSDYPKQILK